MRVVVVLLVLVYWLPLASYEFNIHTSNPRVKNVNDGCLIESPNPDEKDEVNKESSKKDSDVTVPCEDKKGEDSAVDKKSAERSIEKKGGDRVTDKKGMDSSAKMSDKRVITPKTKAIIISSEDRPPEYVIQRARGVEIFRTMDEIPKKDQEKLKAKIAKEVIGKPLTFAKLQNIKQRIIDCQKRYGRSLVMVTVPEQEVTDGVVVINVIEARLGKITVTGNEWFSEERYLQCISVSQDEVINNASISRDVDYLNRSPWRKVDVIYKPGNKFGTTDVELLARDARPIKLYVGSDNTGFKVTDYVRLFAGFNWGNFLDLDHTLSYQYTAAPDFKKFQGHMIYYTAPLLCRDVINCRFGISRIHMSHKELPDNTHIGRSWQVTPSYTFSLAPVGKWKQEVEAGFDLKSTNNDLTVGEQTVSKSYSTIFQLTGKYNGHINLEAISFNTENDIFYQPWRMGHRMTEESYSTLREDSNLRYIYWRSTSNFLWDNPKNPCAIALKLAFQVSSGSLLPLEQFGLGGVNSIRGYTERATNVDQGAIFSTEVRTTPFSMMEKVNSKYQINDRLSFVFFLDMGGGYLQRVNVNLPESYFLAGIGPGVRYHVESCLYVRFDWGIRLTKAPEDALSKTRNQVYFSAIFAW